MVNHLARTRASYFPGTGRALVEQQAGAARWVSIPQARPVPGGLPHDRVVSRTWPAGGSAQARGEAARLG